MKIWIAQSCVGLTLLATPFCYAITYGDGICRPVNNVYVYDLPLNNMTIPADKNKPSTEIKDLKTITSSQKYKAHCDCLTHFTTVFRNVYYTSRSSLSVDTTRGNYTYYRLNDNMSIATSIKILGRGNVPVPFEGEPNVVDSGMYCYAPGEEGTPVTLVTGSEVVVSLLINKPFIGKVSVPPTIVVDLFGGLDRESSTKSTDKLAEVKISGDVVAPQTCEIASGQELVVDFGKIPAAEFSSTPGTAVASHKITKTIQVQCTGMLNENIVYSTFNAEPVEASPTMMKVQGNEDVGLMIYDKWDKIINVNGGTMDMDMGPNRGGVENNSLTFSAAPASATGALPKPGTFEATATITLEIKN